MTPRLLAILAMAPAVAHAEDPACPAGQRWDAAMSMCMPQTPEHHHGGHTHGGMSNAEMFDMMLSPDACGAGNHFEFGMSMCLPVPSAPGHASVMLMGNVFLADIGEQGPRGRRALSAPNWAMLDAGLDLASWNRLELDAMLTAELWTTPTNGYPQLLQIGESQANGTPFLDAQHPHSSPLMGLTLGDVVSLSNTDIRLLKVSFAPRGESTDGPIAFMHRPSGVVNPDAPLGHHIGQDVGHVSSTVIAASLQWGATTVEASGFHGREPLPTQVDLPLGVPDSFAVRVSHLFTPSLLAAASFAEVTDPEGDPAIPRAFRLSASIYASKTLNASWRAHGALVWGGITAYDGAAFLESIDAEAVVGDGDNFLWGRVEAVQRTAAELQVVTAAPTLVEWATVATLGYTRKIVSAGPVDFLVGGSFSANFIPPDFEAAYGAPTLLTGKLFLEARGMQMWFFPSN